jgi:uncharacterized protein YjaG (DUF416 family)
MRYTDFVTLFNKQVYSLDKYRQLRLCVSVCKKLYPDYLNFTEKENWGDSNLLLDAIMLCDNSSFEDVDRNAIEKFLADIDQVIPDTEDFGDELGSYALNSCVAVHESLQFLLDKNPRRVYDVGICLTDTIDFKIQENKTLSEEQIDKNPLMIETRNYLIKESK